MQIARALLRRNPEERILCLCYTNHALDDFLTSLHDDGLRLTAFVRLGSSPKIAEHLKGRCLSSLTESSFSRNQNMRFAKLKASQKILSDRMRELSERLQKKMWGPAWWRTAREFLRRNDYEDELRQLSIPRATDGMETIG